MLTLYDVYCMYNRSRGTDLISPNDLKQACGLMERLSLPTRIRELESGVVVLQSNQVEAVLAEVVEAVKTQGCLTAMELGTILNINPIIAKEYLLQAEN